MPPSALIVSAVLLTGAVWSVVAKKLTVLAAVCGSVIGLLAFIGGGYAGLGMLTLFFTLASAATSFGLSKKQALGFAEAREGRRTAGQVFANGGVAGILGAIAWADPANAHMLQLMMAGSLAAATADTLSSEIGTVMGKRFYNILTLKKDERGLDGVVSAEGTLTGIAGAMLIALVYALAHRWDIAILWITIAGTTGNLADSVLGAALERRHRLGNNMVNFLNTATGAMVCWALFKV